MTNTSVVVMRDALCLSQYWEVGYVASCCREGTLNRLEHYYMVACLHSAVHMPSRPPKTPSSPAPATASSHTAPPPFSPPNPPQSLTDSALEVSTQLQKGPWLVK
jgi:hypothetical protein